MSKYTIMTEPLKNGHWQATVFRKYLGIFPKAIGHSYGKTEGKAIDSAKEDARRNTKKIKPVKTKEEETVNLFSFNKL